MKYIEVVTMMIMNGIWLTALFTYLLLNYNTNFWYLLAISIACQAVPNIVYYLGDEK